MHKILIRQRNELYRFLQFEFRDHADGSLNIIFDRVYEDTKSLSWTSERMTVTETDETDGSKLRVSYHPTGRINFHGMSSAAPIFGEPLFEVTRPQLLFIASVPTIDRLDRLTNPAEADTIVQLPDDFGRLTFSVSLVPTDFQACEPQLLAVNYDGWFGISIRVEPPIEIPEGAERHIIRMVSLSGPYTTQQCSQEQALINVHQKNTQSTGLITSWEPREAVYRLIFAVPMRVPPRLIVRFEDENIVAEVLPPTRPATAAAEIRFKARGPSGYIKTFQPIAEISLHARM